MVVLPKFRIHFGRIKIDLIDKFVDKHYNISHDQIIGDFFAFSLGMGEPCTPDHICTYYISYEILGPVIFHYIQPQIVTA